MADESEILRQQHKLNLKLLNLEFNVSSGSMKYESGKFVRRAVVHIFQDDRTGCYLSRIIGCLSQPQAFNID